MKPILIFKLCILILVFLSGCNDPLGLNTKHTMDEFAVSPHAPLSLPKTDTLPPPQPGQLRPQDQTANQKAVQAIFGTTEVALTEEGVDPWVQDFAGKKTDPNIRQQLEQELEEEKPQATLWDKIKGRKPKNKGNPLIPAIEVEKLKEKIGADKVPQPKNDKPAE